MNTTPQDNKDPIINQTDASQNSTGGASTSDNSVYARFDIPAAVKEKYPDLIDLIIETKSMDDKERQYWFHILPVMNEQQVEKLRTILLNEKNKLAEIDKKYSQPLGQPAPIVEMKDNEIRDKMISVQEKEAEHQKHEADKEAELLKQLENL
jgi:hypothetical protein